MITKPTVFVLGAGASKPYGYPTGSDLRREIFVNLLNDFDHVFPDETILEPWRVPKSAARREVATFLETFAGSPVPSIDLFLAGHPDDVWFNRLGRLAIILRILTAEQKHSMEGAKEDWCDYLFGKLRGGLITPDDFKSRFHENNVTIITFNYDRFLEHFLFEGLQKSFGGITPETVKDQLAHINIVHVFGQIASLPWQDPRDRIEYGRNIREVNVLLLSKNLRIIYDGYENPDLEEARKKIAQATRIFFLGFGYAEENLKVLALPKMEKPQATMICGTHLDATAKQCEDTARQLATEAGLNISQVKVDSRCDCLRLLREYF